MYPTGEKVIDLQTWIKERRVLGSMLNDPVIARHLCETLSPAAFADEKHRTVFAAILRVAESRSITLSSVAEELAAHRAFFRSQLEGLAFLELLVTKHAVE